MPISKWLVYYVSCSPYASKELRKNYDMSLCTTCYDLMVLWKFNKHGENARKIKLNKYNKYDKKNLGFNLG